MKGNIKKLVVCMIIAAIAMFVVVGTASAGQLFPPPIFHSIQGEYAATGGGTCLLAPFGFDPAKPGVPLHGEQGAWVIQTFNSEGVWTFNRDGTGSVTAVNRSVTLPPSGPVSPSAGESKVTFDFHYTLAKGNMISVTADPGTLSTEGIYGPSVPKIYHYDGFSRTGVISRDGKTITLNGGVPDVLNFIAPLVDLPPGAQMFCNQSIVLIWQPDIRP